MAQRPIQARYRLDELVLGQGQTSGQYPAMIAVAWMRRGSAPNSDARTVSFELQESEVQRLAERSGDAIDEC